MVAGGLQIPWSARLPQCQVSPHLQDEPTERGCANWGMVPTCEVCGGPCVSDEDFSTKRWIPETFSKNKENRHMCSRACAAQSIQFHYGLMIDRELKIIVPDGVWVPDAPCGQNAKDVPWYIRSKAGAVTEAAPCQAAAKPEELDSVAADISATILEEARLVRKVRPMQRPALGAGEVAVAPPSTRPINETWLLEVTGPGHSQRVGLEGNTAQERCVVCQRPLYAAGVDYESTWGFCAATGKWEEHMVHKGCVWPLQQILFNEWPTYLQCPVLQRWGPVRECFDWFDPSTRRWPMCINGAPAVPKDGPQRRHQRQVQHHEPEHALQSRCYWL